MLKANNKENILKAEKQFITCERNQIRRVRLLIKNNGDQKVMGDIFKVLKVKKKPTKSLSKMKIK